MAQILDILQRSFCSTRSMRALRWSAFSFYGRLPGFHGWSYEYVFRRSIFAFHNLLRLSKASKSLHMLPNERAVYSLRLALVEAASRGAVLHRLRGRTSFRTAQLPSQQHLESISQSLPSTAIISALVFLFLLHWSLKSWLRLA